MAKFATKADRAFEEQLATLLAPTGYVHTLGGEWNSVEDDEFEIQIRQYHPVFEGDELTLLFFRYGMYLELIDGDRQSGESHQFEFTVTRSGGARVKSIDDLADEATARIQELGDNLMAAFLENQADN